MNYSRNKDGSKWMFRLESDEFFSSEIFNCDCGNGYMHLSTDGILQVCKGYAWDGPSGPAVDTGDFMRGSLAHDALYQMLRERLLPPRCRKLADRLLYRICRADGMPWLRAQWVYCGVRLFGEKFSK